MKDLHGAEARRQSYNRGSDKIIFRDAGHMSNHVWSNARDDTLSSRVASRRAHRETAGSAFDSRLTGFSFLGIRTRPSSRTFPPSSSSSSLPFPTSNGGGIFFAKRHS